jgi:16S rRNA (cytosine967-C5)-methyltransferase
VRSGGRLVYCVCSLEPEEGEAQAAGFLRRHPEFTRVPITPGEGGSPENALTVAGDLRLLPSHWAEEGGMDGFYVARFRRSD